MMDCPQTVCMRHGVLLFSGTILTTGQPQPCTLHMYRHGCRKLSSSHPANFIREFAALSEAPGASLQTYLDWKSQALLSGAPAALQYGDLHGVPMMLVLCEKGRMGDTFPQTFRCSCTARAYILFSASSFLAGSIQGCNAEITCHGAPRPCGVLLQVP